MQIEESPDGKITPVTNDAGDKVYYVTKHQCPGCECDLYTCSCPHFQMGIFRGGGNPFAAPCKHITLVREHETDGRPEHI